MDANYNEFNGKISLIDIEDLKKILKQQGQMELKK